MSFRLTLLNVFLRWTVKPHLARIAGAPELRRHLERSAARLPRPPTAARFAPFPESGDAPSWEICAFDGADPTAWILYLHGGAYGAGSATTHRSAIWTLSRASGAVVAAPNYRLAPEHPYPAALDDALAAYDRLIAEGAPPERIAAAGDSAGGGLAFALAHALERRGGPGLAAVATFSPYLDLTHSGASVRRNATRDVMLPASRLDDVLEGYLAGGDPTDPGASPLFARFERPPPAFIHVGASEILLDDSVRMAEALRAVGGDVVLEIERTTPHALNFYAPFVPEARAAVDRAGAFLAERLGVRSRASDEAA